MFGRAVAADVAVRQLTPHVCGVVQRHSYVSLRFAESANPAEIADEVGNSLETLLSTSTHMIAELKAKGRVSAKILIEDARSGHILVTCDEALTA